MQHVFNPEFIPFKDSISDFINHFDIKGTNYGNQDRNSLKLFRLNDKTINVKSFKVPHFINKVVYKYFRKSKARRSFEYANSLSKLGVGTPQPIAYFENANAFGLIDSYYVSEHLEYDLTYRELTKDLDYPDHENILRAFTRFTFNLHEKGIHFLDHSPGNTLIQLNNGNYKFYLVDLNRMEFKQINFETRIKNFSKLTTHKSMVEVMSHEYAKCIEKDYETVFKLMWNYTEAFQEMFNKKKRLKKKLKFWKK